MASNSNGLVDGGDDSRKRQRSSEKACARRKSNKLFEPNPYQFSENLLRTQSQSIAQNLAIAAVDVNSSISPPPTHTAAEEENHHPSPPQKSPSAPVEDAFIINHGNYLAAAEGFVSRSKRKKELRHKLVLKLEQVRSLLRMLQVWSLQLFADDVGASLSNQMAPVIREEQNGDGEVMVKQRMIPKPYQYYKSSEPKKVNRIKHGRQLLVKKPYAQAFRKCGVLLFKLMKHKYGWVFNSPVDTVALGLPDYHLVIRHPMDLGTVRHRLSENLYTNPFEFAGDVRLTFRNAMLYNPEGDEVHAMAEELLNIFESQWPAIESLAQPIVAGNVKQRQIRRPEEIRRPLSLPNSREMTAAEKGKLISNLQSLPEEKLDIVLEMLRRRNIALNQHGDQVEVEIDSMDTYTLWELHRLVTNYKKNLSKKKRKMELGSLAREESALQPVYNLERHMIPDSVPSGSQEDKLTAAIAKEDSSSFRTEGQSMEIVSRSSSSSYSSSDSSSTSNDISI